MTVTFPASADSLLPLCFDPFLSGSADGKSNLQSDFVQMVAHDLRAPLSNLKAFLELTRVGHYKQGEDVFDKRLSQLIPELARVNRLLDELLDFQRIEAGQLALRKESVSASSLARSGISAVMHCAEVKGLNIVNECGECELNVDADRIVQVIINLLQNAINFAPANTRIWIRSKMKEGRVEFSIIDEGAGVAIEDRNRIFERFIQAETDEKKNGFGLGLAVSAAIVRQHGGEIGIGPQTSRQGGHFWFSLTVSTIPATSGSDRLFSPVIASS